MAPLDINTIASVEIDNLEEDDIDHLFKEISEYAIESGESIENVRKLFAVTQTVMVAKGLQADIALEELDKMASNAGKMGAKRERELLDEIEYLKQQIEDIKGDGAGPSTGTGASSGVGSSVLRDEIRELKQQNEEMLKEMKTKDRDLLHEKNECERYMVRCDDLEKQKRDQHREINQLKDDIENINEQQKIQAASEDSEVSREQDRLKKIGEKNKQIHGLINDIDKLEEERTFIVNENSDLKAKIKDATEQMDKTTNEYLNMKEALKQADITINTLQAENESLHVENQELMSGEQKSGLDDEIMKALNERVEQWKTIIMEKDDQILSREALINKLQDKLAALSVDTNSRSVAVLSKALQERDHQINMLKDQLEIASKDIDENIKMINTLRDDFLAGDGKGLDQHNRLNELEHELREAKARYNAVEKRMLETEEDAMKKDKELADIKSRMFQYESGEYGLAEAVAEIKDQKTQIKVRDRQIEELTQIANRNELQLNEFMEENEDLRDKLGLDPRTPTDWSVVNGDGISQYNTKIQRERALIHTLQQENAKLEDERIEMKLKIRKLAQMAGERAGAIGLTAKDLQAIQDLTTDLKNKNRSESSAQRVKLDVEITESKPQASQLEKDLMDSHKEIGIIKLTNNDLQCRLSDLEKENKKLETGLREILYSLQDQDGQSDITVKCPTLEKLLSVMEMKSASGSFDHNEYLKSQMNMHMGRSKQLRQELKDSRQENSNLSSQVERYKLQVESLENQLRLLEHSTGSHVQSNGLLNLPDKMTNSSGNIIANLNTHLIQVLHELANERKMIAELEGQLEDNNRKFAVVKHQLGLLYDQYHSDKKEWEDEKKSLVEEDMKLKNTREDDLVRLAEFDRLLENLDQDENELKRRLADTSRRITKLHISEAVLTRKCNLSQESESMLRKLNNKLNNEIIIMENAFTERFGSFTRFKDMCNFKIAALQKSLENSVNSSELHKANREHELLTIKYRELLEQGNKLVVQNVSTQQYEAEVQRLEKDNVFLKNELEMQKEKIHNFEAVITDMNKQGYSTGTDINEIQPLSKRLATMEMKELNERQRANHAQNLYEQQKTVLCSLESRNEELETKFRDLTKINLDLQESERDLRDQLAHCVSSEINAKNEERIEELEKLDFDLTQEVSRLKEISDIARNQAEMVEVSNKLHQKEVKSFQNQLLELQCDSDERAIIGKLYRQVLGLQLSEGLATSKLEKSLSKIAKMEEACLKLEQKCDEKNQQLYYIRRQGMSKVHFLNKIIHELRRQFSGAIPISKQEKFSMAMIKLQADRNEAERSVNDARDKQIQVEDKLAELELKHQGLEELMDTLRSGTSAQRVSEWHEKINNLRVSEMKRKRIIDRLTKKIEHLESVISLQERKFEQLESESIAKTREFEEREVFWENREMELECMMRNVADDERKSSKTNLPSKNILKLAPNTDKVNLGKHPVNKELQQNMTIAKNRIQNLQAELKKKDEKIKNLKLNFAEGINVEVLTVDDTPSAQTNALAEATIAGLKQRLELKEENLQRFEDMLKRANSEYEEQTKRYEQEISQLHENLRSKRESHLVDFRQVMKRMSDEMNRRENSARTGLSNKQLARLNELEDIVSEQENAMSALADRLHEARTEGNVWKQKLDEFKNEVELKINRLKEEHINVLAEMEKKVFAKEEVIEAKIVEIDGLHRDLESHAVLGTQAPSNTLKSMVDRLKRQLNEKERQMQSLSQALAQLRSEMVNIAQQNLTSQQLESDHTSHVQKIVKQRTDILQKRIDNLESERDVLQSRCASGEDGKKTSLLEIKLLQDEIKRLQEVNVKASELDMNVKAGDQLTISQPTHINEVNDLKKKIKLLQEQLHSQQMQPPEKPFDNQLDLEKELKIQEERIKWEQAKKWQKTVDRMKEKLKSKEDEINSLHRQAKLSRDQLSRVEREKSTLGNKLRIQSRSQGGSSTTDDKEGGRIQKLTEELDQLKSKNSELAEKVAATQKENEMGKGKFFEDLKARNIFLEQKLESTQRQLTRHILSKKGHLIVAEEVILVEEKLEKSYQEVIKLSEINLELKFQLQQYQVDVPTFKNRISELENKLVSQKERPISASSIETLSSKDTKNLKRILELEATIESMEETIENVKMENKNIEHAPTQARYKRLYEQNIKNEKIIESLKESLKTLEDENDELNMKLESLDFQHSETVVQHSHGKDIQRKNTSIAIRIQESKLKKLEAEINNKNEQLFNAKEVLKEATAREKKLVKEIEALKKKETAEALSLNEASEGTDKYRELMNENNYLKHELEATRIEMGKRIDEIAKIRKGESPSLKASVVEDVHKKRVKKRILKQRS